MTFEKFMWIVLIIFIAAVLFLELTCPVHATTITVTTSKPTTGPADTPEQLPVEIITDTGKRTTLLASPVGDATGGAGRKGWTVWKVELPEAVKAEALWMLSIEVDKYYSLAWVKGIKANKSYITDKEPPSATIEVKE